MSLKLNTKTYSSYGYDVLGSDLVGSEDWVHAGTKLGLSSQEVTSIFDRYQNHYYLNTARAAQGFLGRNQTLDKQKESGKATFNPFRGGYQYDARGFDIGRRAPSDPFKDLRLAGRNDHGNFFKDKLNITVDGNRVTYNDQVYKTQYRSAGPYSSNQWSDTKPNARNLPGSILGGGVADAYRTRSQQTRQVATGQAGAQQTGYILNGAFVPAALYDQLSDTDKSYYGRTFDGANQLDPSLAYAAQVVEGAYQYRRSRSRKKSGLGGLISLGASTLLGAKPKLAESAALGAAPQQITASSPEQINKEAYTTKRNKRRASSSGVGSTALTGSNSLGASTGKTLLGA